MFKHAVYISHAATSLHNDYKLVGQVTLFYRGQKKTFEADLGVFNPYDEHIERIRQAQSASEHYALIWRLVQPQIKSEVEAWVQHVTYHADTIDAYAQLN